MGDTKLYTLEAAMTKGAEIILALALSKMRLFKSGLIISQFTTRAELRANEANFNGYTAGGYPLAAWTGPIFYPAGGVIISSPLVNVAFSGPTVPPVTNSIGGCWVEDASGDVRIVIQFDPTKSLAVLGDGFPAVIQIVEAFNMAAV